MADEFTEENVEEVVDSQAGDVEMGGDGATEAGDARPSEPSLEGTVPDEPSVPRVSFAQYLNSPIVSLMVGSGENESVLTAHQGLLAKSPFFASLFRASSADADATVRQAAFSPDFLFLSFFLYFDRLRPLPETGGRTMTDSSYRPLAPHNRSLLGRRRGRRELPGVPVHGRILSQEDPRPAVARNRSLHPRRRRDRHAAPQARPRLHPGRPLQRPAPQEPRVQQDPLRQLDGQGRDRVRALCIRVHLQRRHLHPGARRQLLGQQEPYAAVRGRGRVPLALLGVSRIRLRRSQ